MKQKEKDLLLKDLCYRLPYEVKMNHIADNEVSPITLIGIDEDYIILRGGGYSYVPVEHYKPYLYPLSSMTEEQKLYIEWHTKYRLDDGELVVKKDEDDEYLNTNMYDYLSLIEWLNKNHFDYQGLIEMGLAIDCTNLNIY